MTETRKGHEPGDADVRTVWWLGLGLLLLTIATLGAMAGLYQYLDTRSGLGDQTPSPLSGTRVPFTGPRLQVSATEDLAALRAEEETALTTYSWVDRSAGRVRIPIARALEILARDGRLGPRGGTP